jgi:Alkaline phosphatase PhoX
MKTSRMVFVCLVTALVLVGGVVVSANYSPGPSSSATPYVVRSVPGVVTKAILTVGDSVNLKPDGVTPYRMVGIPDGLGAYDNGDGTFTVVMNHELGATAGIAREHGGTGAFVSKWIIRKDDLAVVHGEDLIQNIATWNAGSSSYNLPAKGISMGRLCSGSLPPKSAFYNEDDSLGFDGRLFLSGEEVGNEGRLFAHGLDGISYELPRLGKFSWENSVANPATGDKTLVASMDDSTPGQVYVYIGTKTASGNPAERAGLTNGTLYGVKVNGIATENRTTGISSGTTFTLHSLGNVEHKTGVTIQNDSTTAGVTEFLRPEDGAWDPVNPTDFYFVTTDRFDTVKQGTGSQIGRSRLYRLRFNSLNDPAAGGTIDMLLDGTEAQQMMDNITISGRGQVIIQEDPGNQVHIAKIWRYSIANDTLNLIAHHDEERFLAGGGEFLTQDEESSGIIEVSDILGEGWFLLDVQAHYSIAGELVEGGQLLALHCPPGRK